VRRFVKVWQREHQITPAEAYIPLCFEAGDAFQFDWSHETIQLDGVTTANKVDDTSTDPSGSVQWDVSDEVMFYASATRATKAGGFNSSGNSPANTNFDPEEATGYEIGLKGAFLDGRPFRGPGRREFSVFCNDCSRQDGS
jgi:outer membrane receptor protein involved in Fe transport